MDTTTLFETLNAATGMGDAMGLVIKAIGLCGCALIGNLVLRMLFTR